MDSLHGVWRSSMVQAVTSWCCMTGGLQHSNTHQPLLHTMQAALGQLPDQCSWPGSFVFCAWCVLLCCRPPVMQHHDVTARTMDERHVAMLHHNS